MTDDKLAKLTKPYDPSATEKRIYERWERSGFFNPDNLPARHQEPYTIIMPPPNANGHLHAGHALFITLEDIMIRYQRLRGKKALWVPGADHAGFETQIVYERKLDKEGRSRFKLKPQELFNEIMAFTLENKKYMEDEVKQMGASCDWSREKFTLDPDIIRKTQETFVKMYHDQLVYRGKRIINWCAKHRTSLSEVETEFQEKTDPFYYLQYGPFVIGTARPETKFGDKYVVMHPDDKRYQEFKHGQTIELEWINGPVTATIIKDGAIDMEFGTGVMTITPWHDPVDFEIAGRHNLEFEQIIDFQGKLLPIAKEFAGLKIKEAREKIIAKLKAKGLFVKVDEQYKHNIKVCYKCENPIEPQIKDQWFVKMKPLAELALKAVDEGRLKFIPDNYRKIFLHWMNNTIDWNISRQIVWGIPIPAKLCDHCETGFPDLDNKLDQCPNCGGPLRADQDTFDTWFSSGQWPFLSLGYPDDQSFKTFYPTDVMETGNDLIFKWVPRMVIFSLYLTDQVPFHTVYLHGLVNDQHGKKMSKSKGNVISPMDITDKFGTDAFRMALVVGNTPGNNLALADEKVRAYKHFANKLWNITRFIIDNTSDKKLDSNFNNYTAKDNSLITEREAMIKDITNNFDDYRFHLASEKLYHYVWHRLADEIIEDSKPIFQHGSDEERQSRTQFLLNTLDQILIGLHPFMPFITEEIWSIIKDDDSLIMIASWPEKS